MANKRRGEVEVVFDGQTYRMCLTLGALAELEAAFGDQDLLALASRFESGRLKSDDAIRIIGAGLRGAGHDLTDADVGRMRCDLGAAGYVKAVADLVQATFGAASTVADDKQVKP
ncbi:MAG: gene transfer agent family protein, partial [Pseudomonadota bacterium]